MKFHSVKTSMSVAIAVTIVGFNVLIPTLGRAQSSRASEIDRSATQVLLSIKTDPARRHWATRRWQY